MSLDWMGEAACAGSELDFYEISKPNPPGDTGESLDWDAFGRLVSVCVTCPVIRQCAAYALRNQEAHGVWAGTTPRQRHRMDEAHDPVQAIVDKAIKNKLVYDAYVVAPQQATLGEAV